MGGSLKSLPRSCYFKTTSVNHLSFHLALQKQLKNQNFCSSLQGYILSSSVWYGSNRETSPSYGERLLTAKACEKPGGWSKETTLAGRLGEHGVTHLWKWCQRCPWAGCSCVSACEEGCMYHSSVHSPMDWWAACKSRRRSGWVPGAVGAKDKVLSVTGGKDTITLFGMDVPALRSSVQQQK